MAPRNARKSPPDTAKRRQGTSATDSLEQGETTPGSARHQLEKKLAAFDRDLVDRLRLRTELVEQLCEIRRSSELAHDSKGKPDHQMRGEGPSTAERGQPPASLYHLSVATGGERWLDEVREAAVSKLAGGLPADAVRRVFREIDSATQALLAPIRVAYLGPEYSYSHLAAIERFGNSAELVPVASIAAVFEEVDQGRVRAGIVPMENSTDGRIVDTLGMFARLPIRICGEVRMRIHHTLLGQGSRAEVLEVHSKPQALSQCREWLAKNLPAAKLVPTASTTAAAQQAAQHPTIAAIASRQAGTNYGLRTLAENIEDNQDNLTRFAVIGSLPTARSKQDKTTLLLELIHQPGALADAMVIFKRNRLNLTWIESFPKPGRKNEYFFFVEFEGHQQDLAVRRAVKALEKKAVRVEILGSYARSAPVG